MPRHDPLAPKNPLPMSIRQPGAAPRGPNLLPPARTAAPDARRPTGFPASVLTPARCA